MLQEPGLTRQPPTVLLWMQAFLAFEMAVLFAVETQYQLLPALSTETQRHREVGAEQLTRQVGR